MTLMIMLTDEEAEQVRGPSAIDPLAALEPVPHGDGFLLPATVLDDPAHEYHWAFLEKLPQEDIEPPEVSAELPDG